MTLFQEHGSLFRSPKNKYRAKPFWAWNGEARAAHPDARFRDGDNLQPGGYMGDPPHEPQGWFGIFDTDVALLGDIRAHAARRCLGLSGGALAACRA